MNFNIIIVLIVVLGLGAVVLLTWLKTPRFKAGDYICYKNIRTEIKLILDVGKNKYLYVYAGDSSMRGYEFTQYISTIDDLYDLYTGPKNTLVLK